MLLTSFSFAELRLRIELIEWIGGGAGRTSESPVMLLNMDSVIVVAIWLPSLTRFALETAVEAGRGTGTCTSPEPGAKPVDVG